MYERYYKDKVGVASLNIKKAIAGSKTNCRLIYRVGLLGIDDSGSLKLLFRIVSDCGELQFNDPNADNYLQISSSNKKVKITPMGKSTGCIGKAYVRPWSKGLTLYFSNSYLQEGDEIYLDFKRWRIQTFCQKKFQFKLLVDPFATGKYIELLPSPSIEIVPDVPHKLVIIAPTVVDKNQQFHFLIKVEDRWGNPCFQTKGEFTLRKNDNCFQLPAKVRFKGGKTQVKTSLIKGEVVYIEAKYRNLTAISNPIICREKPQHRYFWADFHWQSEETVGTNSLEDNLIFAKDYAFLDAVCPQHNDFQITNRLWGKINQLAKKFTKEGKFVVFPGYEWSGNTHLGGDRNVLYKNEGMPIYRSSHALIDDFCDIDADATTASILFKKLNPKKSLVIAHMGGRYADLQFHDERIERAVEIHSDWGTFEWFVFDALEKGYKVGIVAGSDCHDGRPGASYPNFNHFNSYGGLTCVLAKNLSRNDIFQAVYNRHCYATTGARIFLEAQCLINGRLAGIMGDIVRLKNNPVLKIETKGTSVVDRVEIFNQVKKIYCYYPQIKPSLGKEVKIIWRGAKVKGRSREFLWEGVMEIKNNFIEKIEAINFFNQNKIYKKDSRIVKWKGKTTGGDQGFILKLKKHIGEIFLIINSKKITFPIEEINQIPKVYPMGGVKAEIEIYETQAEEGGRQSLSFQYQPRLSKGAHPIFVKVIQRDGHLAWSSPIYFLKS